MDGDTGGIFLFDPVTGNNLKRWLQQHNLLRSQVVQATQMSASRAKTVRSIKDRKSLVCGEERCVTRLKTAARETIGCVAFCQSVE